MSYNISFFINGYGQQPDDIPNTNVIPELPVLAEDGFSFEGWYLDEDLTVEAIVGTSIESDIVLYASWSRQRGGWGPQTATNGASTYAAPRPGIDIVGPGIDGDDDGVADEKIVFINSGSIDYYHKHPEHKSKWYVTAMYDKSASNFYGNNKKFGIAVPSGAPAAYLNTPAAIESWRTTVLSGYKYKDSDGSIKNISFPTRGSIPTIAAEPLYTQDTSGTVRLTKRGTNDGYPYGFQISGANINTTNINVTEHGTSGDANNYIIPTFVIFELCGGGGGGGGNSTSSRNGAGGGGGGFITGVLKLDFNKYDAYDFKVGGGGSGGGGDIGLFFPADGTSGGDSCIYGVKINTDGTEELTCLATAEGGEGGPCANDSDWSNSHSHKYKSGTLINNHTVTVEHSAHTPAQGGTATVHTSTDIYCYKAVRGGSGGKTNNTGVCKGGTVSGFTKYYAEDSTLKTRAGMSKTYSTANGGSAGSSSHSGGGGASVLGSGGAGGGTSSDGNPGNGPGAGGGGGRWDAIAYKWGADGKPGYLAIYY